jgi:hypothetical protein
MWNWTASWTRSRAGSPPSTGGLSPPQRISSTKSLETALTWPEAQRRIQALLERGLQRDADFEKAWPDVLGTLLDTEISSQSSLQKNGSAV